MLSWQYAVHLMNDVHVLLLAIAVKCLETAGHRQMAV